LSTNQKHLKYQETSTIRDTKLNWRTQAQNRAKTKENTVDKHRPPTRSRSILKKLEEI